MKFFSLRCLIILMLIILLGGCASDQQYKDTTQSEYEKIKKSIDKGEYNTAAYSLEQFIIKHPYSRYAIQGELLRIFAAYKGNELILAETLSTRFIDRHPRHPNIDYAKYMLAMSYYKQRGGAEHDPTQNQAAIDAFKRLIREHPDSTYAKDGRSRLQTLYNTLADHELHVGKYYYDRNLFVAAANRFQEVVRRFQTSPAIEEALYYLASSYAEMGLKKDARQSAILLRHNYPKSSWSKKALQFL
jgi:outer membrane protein assembly factor BamD